MRRKGGACEGTISPRPARNQRPAAGRAAARPPKAQRGVFPARAGGRYDHHIGGFQTRQKHQAVMRDYRGHTRQASAVGDRRQYHRGLLQRGDRPNDKCVHSNVGRVCGIGIAYHSDAREVGNGKRQGQRREDRKTHADRRQHSADLPTTLPRVQE